jgi:hypothetical protein
MTGSPISPLPLESARVGLGTDPCPKKWLSFRELSKVLLLALVLSSAIAFLVVGIACGFVFFDIALLK